MKIQKMKKPALLACCLTVVLFSSSAGAVTVDTKLCPNNGTPQPIPKILHTVWLGGALMNLEGKPYADIVLKSKRKNPDWTTYIWYDPRLVDESGTMTMKNIYGRIQNLKLKNINELARENDTFHELYEELVYSRATMNLHENRNRDMITWAYWADIIRYGVLYKYGGIYCDPKTKVGYDIKERDAEGTMRLVDKPLGQLYTGPCDDVLLREFVGSPKESGYEEMYQNNDYLGCIKNSKIMKALYEGALKKTKDMIAYKNGKIQLTFPTFGNRGQYTYLNTGPKHLSTTYAEKKGLTIQDLIDMNKNIFSFRGHEDGKKEINPGYTPKEIWPTFDVANALDQTETDLINKLRPNVSKFPSIFKKSTLKKFTAKYALSWGGKRDSYPRFVNEAEKSQRHAISQIKILIQYEISRIKKITKVKGRALPKVKGTAIPEGTIAAFPADLKKHYIGWLNSLIQMTQKVKLPSNAETAPEPPYSGDILYELEKEVIRWKENRLSTIFAAKATLITSTNEFKKFIGSLEKKLDPEYHIKVYIKNYIIKNNLCQKKTAGQLTNTRSRFDPKNPAHKRNNPDTGNPNVLPAEIVVGLEKYCQ
ncbi:MAG: hypothetical protein GY754_04745 [bacterium]|nr:hypothetical protein [bacterium]